MLRCFCIVVCLLIGSQSLNRLLPPLLSSSEPSRAPKTGANSCPRQLFILAGGAEDFRPEGHPLGTQRRAGEKSHNTCQHPEGIVQCIACALFMCVHIISLSLYIYIYLYIRRNRTDRDLPRSVSIHTVSYLFLVFLEFILTTSLLIMGCC